MPRQHLVAWCTLRLAQVALLPERPEATHIRRPSCLYSNRMLRTCAGLSAAHQAGVANRHHSLTQATPLCRSTPCWKQALTSSARSMQRGGNAASRLIGSAAVLQSSCVLPRRPVVCEAKMGDVDILSFTTTQKRCAFYSSRPLSQCFVFIHIEAAFFTPRMLHLFLVYLGPMLRLSPA